MEITAEVVKGWGACYSAERLEALYDRACTPLEVCTRTDGLWVLVPPRDRLWTVLRPEVFPERDLRVLACDFAEEALKGEREEGRVPNPALWEALTAARGYADGRVSASELELRRDKAKTSIDVYWCMGGDAAAKVAGAVYAVDATTMCNAQEAAWHTAWYTARNLTWDRPLQIVIERIKRA